MVESNEKFYTGKDEYLSIMFARWRRLHVTTMFIALMFSVLGCLTFISFMEKFSPYCPIGAKIHIRQKDNINFDIKKHISRKLTKWGNWTSCYFLYYTPAVQILTSLISLLLFCSCDGQSNLQGGFSSNSQLKIVPPTCVISFAVAVVSLSAAMVLTFGGSELCISIELHLESCSSLETLHWDGKSKLQYFQAYLKGAQVSYWLTTYAFLIHFVMTLLRWYTNVDTVLAEERELRENPNFHDIVLQDLEEDEDTLRSVSLYAKQK